MLLFPTVCEAPIFSSGASGVGVEPFSSTVVSSEILYLYQTGLLQERRGTLLCGKNGRWNPDPQSLCTGKDPIMLRVCAQVWWFNKLLLSLFTYPFYLSVHTNLILTPVPDKSLSTAATAAIMVVVCLLVAFVAGTVCVHYYCLYQQVEQEGL